MNPYKPYDSTTPGKTSFHKWSKEQLMVMNAFLDAREGEPLNHHLLTKQFPEAGAQAVRHKLLSLRIERKIPATYSSIVWTSEEDSIIRVFTASYPQKTHSKRLEKAAKASLDLEGRTKAEIICRMMHLAGRWGGPIYRALSPQGRLWPPEENAKFTEMVTSGAKPCDIYRAFPDRKINTLKDKYNNLRRKLRIAPRNRIATKNPATAGAGKLAADMFLVGINADTVEKYTSLTDGQITEIFYRTGVLNHRNPWSVKDIDLLEKAGPTTKTSALAYKLAKPRGAICQVAALLNIQLYQGGQT